MEISEEHLILIFYFFFPITKSATTAVADSPFAISQADANQAFNAAEEGGVAEAVNQDTSIPFFHKKNVYSKL